MNRKKGNRSANGSGTIRRRKDGRWEARITIGRDPATGKQAQKSYYGKTQGEVRKKLAKNTVEVDTGIWKDPENITLREWSEIWINEYTASDKPHTLQTYRSILKNHIIPDLGACLLQKITVPQVQAFYNHLTNDKGLTPKTVKNIHGVLHKLFNQAVMVEYLKSNPADHVALPKVTRPEIHPLDRDQIPVFLQAAANDPFYNLFTVDLFTGLRISEIIGLTWDCINFGSGTLTVYRQLIHVNTGYQWGSPKNGKERTITPAPFIIDTLKKVRTAQKEAQLQAGSAWNNPSNFIFTDAIGQHIKHNTLRKHFKKIAITIDNPKLRFHDLRHTFAVASLQAGDDIKTVQENLGHHSAAFTMDTYAHVTESMHKASAERMQNFIKAL